MDEHDVHVDSFFQVAVDEIPPAARAFSSNSCLSSKRRFVVSSGSRTIPVAYSWHKERIEDALFSRLQSLFGLETRVTLYDLTNTWFEGLARRNGKAKRGHSKEKRGDCPLVTLGLVLDGSGFVRRSKVFAGNAVEARTLEEMLEGLAAPEGALVILDRGIATEEKLHWLKERNYRYLVMARGGNANSMPGRRSPSPVLPEKNCGSVGKTTAKKSGSTVIAPGAKKKSGRWTHDARSVSRRDSRSWRRA
jgi:hypothetical protein